MELDVKDWIYIAGIAASLIMSAITAYPTLLGMRYKHQKENVDAVKVALEIARMDVAEQFELKKEVQHLKDILEKKRYKIAVDFRLGDSPVIEKATIEAYDV